jgi:signal transduction histidine kinase/CheY-like chemotaxis protein
MIRNLRDTTLKNSEQDWLKTNLAKFSRMLQGQKDLLAVGRLILSELAPVVSAQQGVFYTMDVSKEEPTLKLLASYAYKQRKHADNFFKLGEGLVGQCALEKERILLVNAPPDYITITSGLGEAVPVNIVVLPVLFEGQVKAILELASFERFSPTHLAFLDQLTESIGIVLNTIEANMRTEDLLKQSQSLARELQSQQEELRQTNAELGEKARLLAQQNVEVEQKNSEVEQARQALEEKAKQLALTSKYKSEFLANMSHELRTPLNSLLILSEQLSKNGEGNLYPKQVDFAKTIHSSGNDLLALINDILDLSKIESGTVVVDVGEVWFRDLGNYVERTFRHVAEAKKVEFELDLVPNLPRSIHTDAKRLQQVLKNLLSNAFKFTERGRVRLEVRAVTEGFSREHELLGRAGSAIAFSVHDTGIGISADKQQIIFEAFQQADGSTSRKYGGTGLGLAISRGIATLLGGELRLSSIPGHGSTFTLYIPHVYMAPPRVQRPRLPAPDFMPTPSLEVISYDTPPAIHGNIIIDEEQTEIRPGDRTLLVVENDIAFARLVVDVARERGFKAVVAHRGAEALSRARERKPSAITLDLRLPDMDGLRVLDRLKHDLGLRHVPVQVITTDDEERERALRKGALDVVSKPLRTRDGLVAAIDRLAAYLDSKRRSILLVEPDATEAARKRELLSFDSVDIRVANTFKEAMEALSEERPDVVITGLALPDGHGLDLVTRAASPESDANVPFIVHMPQGALPPDQERIDKLVHTAVLKQSRSDERLFDEVALFLHTRVDDLQPQRRTWLEKIHASPEVLAGKQVLIVDDDIRNIFAMTTILEEQGMHTRAAETGHAAISLLEQHEGIDVVLMDIMMPEMDGYDTIRAIRARESWRSLPIIAVTAKAMKGDREKCFEAGATDYVAKPVDPEQLFARLRFWLHR